MTALENRGWRLAGADDFFVHGNRYKGLHLAVERDEGLRFELQLHTPTSIKIKAKTEHLYRTVRGEKLEPYSERLAAYSRSVALSENVGQPRSLCDVVALGRSRVAPRRREQRPPERHQFRGETLPTWQARTDGAVTAVARRNDVTPTRSRTTQRKGVDR